MNEERKHGLYMKWNISYKKKKKFERTWVKLEDDMLSILSQTKTNTVCEIHVK